MTVSEKGPRTSAVLRWFIVLCALAIGTFAYTIGHAIWIANQAETNLHATLFAIRLVEQFVEINGRWPASWEELEGLPVSKEAPSPKNGLQGGVVRIGGQHGYPWPAASSKIRTRVEIDFAVEPLALVDLTPTDFKAIQPRGPCFTYNHYGFIESLQTTIRNRLQARLPKPQKGVNMPHSPHRN